MTNLLATQITDSDLAQLRGRFSGQIIRPGDADYDQARKVWNGIIDKYPELIVRPHYTSDVIAAVNFAREQRLLLSVRGGGHNVAGHATNDGGIVIDLSSMKRITVDPVNRTVRAEGGVTWGELDQATQVYGLAAPGGVFSKTGIAGLTLGGGFGWLRSKFGLSCDNLIAAELVTADGRQIRASQTENPDLLWGLRGGGGNFGVVTTFEFQLHQVGPEVMQVFTFFEVENEERMKDAVRYFRDFTATAPDEVSTLFAFGVVPPVPVFPVELHGKHFAAMAGVYAGSVTEGQRIMQPLQNFSTPLLDNSGVRPYVEAQQVVDHDFPDGLRYYWKSINLRELDETAIEQLVAHAKQQPSPFSTTDLWDNRGAVKRGSAETSAFYGREAAFLLNAEANWIDPAHDEANITWVRDFVAAMQPFSDGSRYMNFAGFQEEGEAMMQKAFGSQYARLVALKRQYDPDNLFSLNQNIKPE